MVDKIKRVIKLWGIYAKLDLIWILRNISLFIANIIADMVSSLATVTGVFLLAQRFGEIGGMTKHQIIFMLGYASLIEGIRIMFFSMNNISHISRIIGRGQLDHRLIQPNPLWMQLITEGFIPFSGSSMLFCGIGIIIYSAIRLNILISFAFISQIIIFSMLSTLLILSISYLFSCIAFYAPVAGEEVSTSAVGLFRSLKGFPLSGMSLANQVVLTTILPIGLTAWFPTNIILGEKLPLPNYFMVVITVIFATVATIMFKKGLNYYGKKGSIRYTDRGHRR
jgi:ABC-2 type transport system permease protein